MIRDAYNDSIRSIFNYLNNFLNINSLDSTTEVYDFDAHAVNEDLPDKDLVGIYQHSIRNIDERYFVMLHLTVCTKADDTNLKRLRILIGKLFTKIVPNNRAKDLFNIDSSGVTIGTVRVTDDVLVSPITRSKSRPSQHIILELNFQYNS